MPAWLAYPVAALIAAALVLAGLAAVGWALYLDRPVTASDELEEFLDDEEDSSDTTSTGGLPS